MIDYNEGLETEERYEVVDLAQRISEVLGCSVLFRGTPDSLEGLYFGPLHVLKRLEKKGVKGVIHEPLMNPNPDTSVQFKYHTLESKVDLADETTLDDAEIIKLEMEMKDKISPGALYWLFGTLPEGGI